MDINTNIKTNNIIASYWDKRSEEYDNSNGHMFHSEEEKNIWKKFLKNAIGDKKKLILDVGCGTGFLSILLSELGHYVIGIDISNEMLKIAKKNAKKLKIPFILSSSENLNFIPETFDVIISRHLLWTLSDPKKSIQQWKNLIVSGGSIIIIDGKWDFSKNHIYNFDIYKKLPLYNNKKRPDIDIQYLVEEGFQRSSITTYEPCDIFGNNLKYLEIKDYFLIKAIK